MAKKQSKLKGWKTEPIKFKEKISLKSKKQGFKKGW
jgi:hypothetical protein